MENQTSTENTKEIDKAFEIDCDKYKDSSMKRTITSYLIAHDKI